MEKQSNQSLHPIQQMNLLKGMPQLKLTCWLDNGGEQLLKIKRRVFPSSQPSTATHTFSDVAFYKNNY